MPRFNFSYARKFWFSIHEPRPVTAAVVVAYSVTAVAAIVIAMTTHLDPPPVSMLVQVSGIALMAAGGAIGVPMAWRGEWAIERIAAFMCAGGVAAETIQVVAVDISGGLEAPVQTYLGLITASILWITRFLRTRRAPFADRHSNPDGPLPLPARTGRHRQYAAGHLPDRVTS